MTNQTIVSCVLLLFCSACSTQEAVKPALRSQNPSPMVERTRAHQRVLPGTYDGIRDTIPNILPRTFDVYLPNRFKDRSDLDLVLNFHSAPYVTHHAAESTGLAFIGVTINLGGGSSAFNAPFVDSAAFPHLLDVIGSTLQVRGVTVGWKRVIIVGFSAGYGAVRRILSHPSNRELVYAALLLDGIHASYVPEGTVLAEGGRIDSSNLETFLSFAKETSRPESTKRFMITHSEVFPGTFVSTTESTDWIIEKMSLKRTPVLAWGPLGMQQTSEVRSNNFSILGFAGNSGVDHGDHLHAFGYFLRLMLENENVR